MSSKVTGNAVLYQEASLILKEKQKNKLVLVALLLVTEKTRNTHMNFSRHFIEINIQCLPTFCCNMKSACFNYSILL